MAKDGTPQKPEREAPRRDEARNGYVMARILGAPPEPPTVDTAN